MPRSISERVKYKKKGSKINNFHFSFVSLWIQGSLAVILNVSREYKKMELPYAREALLL